MATLTETKMPSTKSDFRPVSDCIPIGQSVMKSLVTRNASIPFKYSGQIIKEYLIGLKRRLNERGLQYDENLAMEYFRLRGIQDKFEDFTDSSSNWYLSVLSRSQVLGDKLLTSGLTVLDVGCGRGGLLSWLLAHNYIKTNYVGIDQDPTIINRCKEIFQSQATFVLGDIRSISEELSIKSDAIFVINVLPYIQDPVSLLKQCAGFRKDRDSLLVILDPSPSPYWEREFGGFKINLRSTEHLIETAAVANWVVKEVYYLSLAGIPFMRIAQLVIFTPEE